MQDANTDVNVNTGKIDKAEKLCCRTIMLPRSAMAMPATTTFVGADQISGLGKRTVRQDGRGEFNRVIFSPRESLWVG